VKFSLETTDLHQILSYDDNQLVIGPEKKTYLIKCGDNLIVTPSQIITDSKIGDITQLTSHDILYIQKLAPELVIFTAGSKTHLPHFHTISEMGKVAIGVEYMSLGSACRTYNLLALEGRHVMLILITQPE